MPEIISKADAKSLGLRFFFTGVPCLHGHVADREVSSGKCFPCVRQSWEKVRRRLGSKPFRPNEERRAAQAEGSNKFMGVPCQYGHTGLRWTHNCLCVACSQAASAKSAKGKGYILQRQWAQINKPAIAKIKLRYRKTAHGRLADRAGATTRRARFRNAIGKHTSKDISERLAAQKRRCAWCKIKLKSAYHVDHITPLARGGSNEPRNIQILCQPCNSRKWAKDPIVFAREDGRLL